MYEILKREELNPSSTRFRFYAPYVAGKAQPGQFVILRVDENGERVPFTIAGYDREAGTVDVIVQIVGATTMKLNRLREGESVASLTGPLGNPTRLDGLSKAAVVGGGLGCAIALPIAQELHRRGCCVHSVVGFRTKDLIILEKEFAEASDLLTVMTDDGSNGRGGLVSAGLEELILAGNIYDEVICIGPPLMMKFVCLLTKKYGIKTTVSMNSIMVDGTGMCGCCRLTVGGETKFACVDGPDFDGHLVDFDEAISRGNIYGEFERHAYDEACNLLKKEVE